MEGAVNSEKTFEVLWHERGMTKEETFPVFENMWKWIHYYLEHYLFLNWKW